jgi:recombination DNA repair RAD52 pathway protein
MQEREKESGMTAFNAQQTKQLLAPIRETRVLRDGKGHSHVSQQDITAHLIRVFGFGSFDTDIVSVECVFEQERADKNGVLTGRFDVCYRALLRLTIRDEHGREVCHYEDGSTATAQNQTRGDAHDLAYKSALSLAKKRAAINLGDQFGLSLYNKGQTDALVRGTLVLPAKPEGDEKPPGDVQEGVAQQVSLGNDEIDREGDAA